MNKLHITVTYSINPSRKQHDECFGTKAGLSAGGPETVPFLSVSCEILDVDCSVCPTAIGMKEENYRKLDEQSRKKIHQRISLSLRTSLKKQMAAS